MVTLVSDGHQTRAPSGHTDHALFIWAAKDPFVVEDPRPGEPIRRGPHRRICGQLRWPGWPVGIFIGTFSAEGGQVTLEVRLSSRARGFHDRPD